MDKSKLIEKWKSCIITTDKATIVDGFEKDLNQFENHIKEKYIKIINGVRFFDSYGGSVEFKEAEKYRKQGYNSAKLEIIKAIRDSKE